MTTYLAVVSLAEEEQEDMAAAEDMAAEEEDTVVVTAISEDQPLLESLWIVECYVH
jgi:hypothetical protein